MVRDVTSAALITQIPANYTASVISPGEVVCKEYVDGERRSLDVQHLMPNDVMIAITRVRQYQFQNSMGVKFILVGVCKVGRTVAQHEIDFGF